MVGRLRPLLAALIAAALAAGLASAFPIMEGNDNNTARRFVVMDTIAIPVNKTRGVYLVEPTTNPYVRQSVDSLLNRWRDSTTVNGFVMPFRFRRIQHIIVFNNSIDEEQLRMTIFKADGTSHFRWVNQAYQVLDLPFEADSIQFQADPSTQLDLTYVLW